jgi:hypothetical protein
MLYGGEIRQPFAAAKKEVRMIHTHLHFFPAKKRRDLIDFKIVTLCSLIFQVV